MPALKPGNGCSCFTVRKSLNEVVVASTAGGLRHCNAAAFASLKNLAALDVFNADSVVSEPKEAAYATTG
ncbi:MAG: hypothetical protein V4725_01745 [Bacteroidota bacterium]